MTPTLTALSCLFNVLNMKFNVTYVIVHKAPSTPPTFTACIRIDEAIDRIIDRVPALDYVTINASHKGLTKVLSM